MTLSYEKALALKEAGWPQPQFAKKNGIVWIVGNADFDLTGAEISSSKEPYEPTLEELIAGCPVELKEYAFALVADANNWNAMYMYRSIDNDMIEAIGATPLE